MIKPCQEDIIANPRAIRHSELYRTITKWGIQAVAINAEADRRFIAIGQYCWRSFLASAKGRRLQNTLSWSQTTLENSPEKTGAGKPFIPVWAFSAEKSGFFAGFVKPINSGIF